MEGWEGWEGWEDGGERGRVEEEAGTDFRTVGTLRLMFSRSLGRSAWKEGWRNVQLWVKGN